jgi:glycosyltransferase involved in cell wall biosynthesis
MRISIAMCTFDGASFLVAQLESFLCQTRLPDELVVCDDGSTDATVQLLEVFRNRAAFPVRIVRNANNLGSTKNFEQAIALCQYDLIFLADQDDVWFPEKIEEMVKVFEQDAKVGLVFCDASIVGVDLKPMGSSVWKAVEFGLDQQRLFNQAQAFEILIRGNVIMGAACAFRNQLCNEVLPIASPWIHDAWIGLIASMTVPIRGIAKPLMFYRQHENQQIGAIKKTMLEKLFGHLWDQNLNAYVSSEFEVPLQCHRLLLIRVETSAASIYVAAVKHKIQHLERRKAGRVLEEWRNGGYRRFARGWRTALKDLLYLRGLTR